MNTNIEVFALDTRCPWAAKWARAFTRGRAQRGRQQQFAGYYSTAMGNTPESSRSSSFQATNPSYLPGVCCGYPQGRKAPASSWRRQHACVCEVSAQGRESKMSYFSFDLINLIGLLRSSQSQLNHSLPAAVEELQSARCRAQLAVSASCSPCKGAVPHVHSFLPSAGSLSLGKSESSWPQVEYGISYLVLPPRTTVTSLLF